MRVALVLGRNGFGGSESQAKLLVAGLLAAGAEVDVILIEGDGGTDGFGSAVVRVLASKRRSGISSLFDMIRALLALRRLLGGTRYDVAHAVMARAYVLVPIATLGRHGRPRIIAWRRNEGIHLRKRSLSAALEWAASKATDLVVCNSRSVQAYWIERGHILPHRSCVIPNALEDWRFEASGQTKVRHAVGRIIAVGGLKRVKGHAWLIETIGQLRPSDRPQVVIVGEGECRGDLIRTARENEVELVLTGYMQDPRPWLESSEIFVQTSRSEGLSNALLEAMAQRVAIIATGVGGTEEALGDAGIIVEYKNSPQLIDAMETLLADSGLRNDLGAAAFQRANSGYRLESIVTEHLDVYRGL